MGQYCPLSYILKQGRFPVILVDTNQLTISHLMVDFKITNDFNIDTIRKTIIRTLLKIRKTYSSEYGEIVLCYDSKNYWRKSVFPYYKQNRKKERENSGFDWEKIFSVLNNIRDEIKENLPFKVLCVDGAESDDIIAVLVDQFQDEPSLILSQDKDFMQLHRYPNVRQYDFIHKKWITCKDPIKMLREHIIKGDRSDGIPNILSGDDVFVSGKVQKAMSKEKIEKLTELDSESFDNYVRLRNWKRNAQLIDFTHIPENVVESILEQFNEDKVCNKLNLLYFSKNNITELLNEL